MPHLSVVIPVYEAEDCLGELYRRLRESLEPLSSDFEIWLVDDGSADRSWKVICELAKNDARVKGIQLSRNFGQHRALTAGLDYCDGDWVVVMDCDLQDRPEEIPALYRKAREGFEIVLARRVHRSDKPSKILSSSAFYRLFSYLTDIRYDKDVGNFRILSRKVAQNLRLMREQLRFFPGLVHWLGFPAASVEVRHDPRFKGRTTYTFGKLCKLALDAIIDYSDKPLRLCVKAGFAMATVSFVYGVYVLIQALRIGSPVMGWSSLIVSLYFLGGIIIAILGVIGIYLGKTFDEAKKRPLYVVARHTFLND